MLIFVQQVSWTLFFQNILTNSIIHKFNFYDITTSELYYVKNKNYQKNDSPSVKCPKTHWVQMTLYLPASGLKSYINTNIKFKILNHKIIHSKKFLHFWLVNLHNLKLLTIFGNVGRYIILKEGLLLQIKTVQKKGQQKAWQHHCLNRARENGRKFGKKKQLNYCLKTKPYQAVTGKIYWLMQHFLPPTTA